MKKDNSKIIAIILVSLAVIVLIIPLFNKKQLEEENDINIVRNYSKFYTVNSCLYRFTNYLSSKDSDNLLLLLNDKYKNDNKITKDNVLNFFSDVDENSTFISKKMYQQVINKNITKYYVYGYIQKNQLFDENFTEELTYDERYFIVYLDTEKKIFSVEPYSGKIFMEGVENEE